MKEFFLDLGHLLEDQRSHAFNTFSKEFFHFLAVTNQPQTFIELDYTSRLTMKYSVDGGYSLPHLMI